MLSYIPVYTTNPYSYGTVFPTTPIVLDHLNKSQNQCHPVYITDLYTFVPFAWNEMLLQLYLASIDDVLYVLYHSYSHCPLD